MHAQKAMNTIFVAVISFLMFLGTGITPVHAQEQDVKGSSDHPLISRYKGSSIIGHDSKEYNEYLLPLGKQTRDQQKKIVLSKSQKLEGKVTRILYMSPKGLSSLEVYRNYQAALKKAGFETLFACSGKECGEEGYLGEHILYSSDPDRKLKNTEWTKYALSAPKDQRYLSAKLARPEGDVYVSLYVAFNGIDLQAYAGRPLALLEIIEMKPMAGEMVKVNADAMEQEIRKTGRVALYSLFFDTDKADIKPESEPTLKEIAKLLSKNAKMKLYVTGHTDNAGTLQHNLDLSKRRAEAVVKALSSKHGVDAKRLHAAGFGPMSPVASNAAEEGRAKNRRVELVEQ